MSEWYTYDCKKTKEALGKNYECCNSCHEDDYEIFGLTDQMEKYTPFKDLLFWACCGFPKLSDDEWKEFERKLEALGR